MSFKTVSRVVNGDPHVSDEKRRAVQAAIADLGFRPNVGAVGLRRGRTQTIGLVLPDTTDHSQSQFARSVERAAFHHDSLLFAATSGSDAARERLVLARLTAHRIDGLIIIPAPGADHSYLQTELNAGLCVVAAANPLSGVAVDCVRPDGSSGARLAVAHLLAKGHRGIAFLGDAADREHTRERRAGFEDALRHAGFPPDPSLIRISEPSAQGMDEAVRALRRNQRSPTALITASARPTLAALRAADEDTGPLAHIALDDLPNSDLLAGGLTVAAEDPNELGARAAGLLFERLQGLEGPPTEVIVPPRLVLRASSEMALSTSGSRARGADDGP